MAGGSFGFCCVQDGCWRFDITHFGIPIRDQHRAWWEDLNPPQWIYSVWGLQWDPNNNTQGAGVDQNGYGVLDAQQPGGYGVNRPSPGIGPAGHGAFEQVVTTLDPIAPNSAVLLFCPFGRWEDFLVDTQYLSIEETRIALLKRTLTGQYSVLQDANDNNIIVPYTPATDNTDVRLEYTHFTFDPVINGGPGRGPYNSIFMTVLVNGEVLLQRLHFQHANHVTNPLWEVKSAEDYDELRDEIIFRVIFAGQNIVTNFQLNETDNFHSPGSYPDVIGKPGCHQPYFWFKEFETFGTMRVTSSGSPFLEANFDIEFPFSVFRHNNYVRLADTVPETAVLLASGQTFYYDFYEIFAGILYGRLFFSMRFEGSGISNQHRILFYYGSPYYNSTDIAYDKTGPLFPYILDASGGPWQRNYGTIGNSRGDGPESIIFNLR